MATTLLQGRRGDLSRRQLVGGVLKEKSTLLQLWQVAYRTTKPSTSLLDSMSVLAVLTRRNRRHFIIIKEFRIPMMQWCIALPAGNVSQHPYLERVVEVVART